MDENLCQGDFGRGYVVGGLGVMGLFRRLLCLRGYLAVIVGVG